MMALWSALDLHTLLVKPGLQMQTAGVVRSAG
jgi:hypothetical protein